jgi:hypothetical protein
MRIAGFVLLIFLGLAFAALQPAWAQQGAGNAPGLESQSGPLAQPVEKVYDFGDLMDGKEYVHVFVVRNVGTAPLEIKKVIKI